MTRPLRGRSPKQEALYVLRRRLVHELLQERPWCEVRWDDRCDGAAVDVDEVLSRGQGGSILDETNLQTTCRPCHRAKHENPSAAVLRGVTQLRRDMCQPDEHDACTDSAPCLGCPRPA